MDTSLDLQVKALLEARRGDWQKVADGSGVSYSWLSKFANGHIENPGYATLKKLFEHLTEAAAPPFSSAAKASAAARGEGSVEPAKAGA
jgi:transcriptional regulator with XRE-family HTH domain